MITQTISKSTLAVARAAAHAADPLRLPAAGRFRGVTDLEVARVLRALENGTEAVQGGRHVWQAVPALPRPFTLARTGAVLAEMIRTGLVFGHSEPVRPGVRQVRAIPAIVHARRAAGSMRALCPANRPRYRLTDLVQAVDCPMCLALLENPLP